MKTQTYIDFKNFVKTNCVIPYNDYKKDGYKLFRYDGDAAHLIYTAWYIFKHRLTGDAIEEYIKKDFDATKKHFTHNGCNMYYGGIQILKPNAVKSKNKWGTEYYASDQYEIEVKCSFCGGDYISLPKWKDSVMKLYNYWNAKLHAENFNNAFKE